MKLIPILTLALASLGAVSLHAADKVVPGPKGGRLLATAPQAIEFFVNADRKVEVAFYDAALKPVAVGSRTVAVFAEPEGKRTPVALEKGKQSFVSTAPLPAGEPYRVVVQVRESADAKPQNFRVQLNLENCAECSHPEYACTCGH